MKSLLWVLLSFVIVGALGVAACGGGNTKPPLTPDGPDMDLEGGAPPATTTAPTPPG